FTQAARKHKIGKARVVYVMCNSYVVAELSGPPDGEQRYLFLGDDHTGRAIEVVAIEQNNQWLILHAMDLRAKFKAIYEQGKMP
ncbi:MAG: hypothetical protein ACRDPW_03670, partial [Mycobacteriales bacterium]